jgi:hypothetical protein
MTIVEDLKNCFTELDSIIPVIDKIGSGFEEPENTALALLLYFKEEKVLDKLAKVRKIISLDLQDLLGVEKFNEFIEQEVDLWKPPYNSSRQELLSMLREDKTDSGK